MLNSISELYSLRLENISPTLTKQQQQLHVKFNFRIIQPKIREY